MVEGVVFCHIQDALTGKNDDVPNKHLEGRNRCMINRQLSRVYRVHFLYKNKPDFQYFFKSLRIILPSLMTPIFRRKYFLAVTVLSSLFVGDQFSWVSWVPTKYIQAFI